MTRTMRAVTLATTAVAGAAGVFGHSVRAEQAATDTKKVVVTVLDAGNKSVTGLTAGDFAIKEGDAARDITAVDQSDPLLVEVLVDTSRNLVRMQKETRAAISAFVKQVLATDPKAQVALAEVGDAAVRVEDFTSKGGNLEKSIQLLVPKADDTASFLDGLQDAAKDLQKKPSARKVIVLFTIDETPDHSGSKTTAAIVRQSGAVVWAVSYRGATNNGGARDAVLDSVTKASGGGQLQVSTPATIATPFTMLADIVTHQYVVSYTRPAGGSQPDAVFVSVKRSGAHVYAPQWPPK